MPHPKHYQEKWFTAETEKYRQFERILMEEMTEAQLVVALERWELICEQRDWAVPADKLLLPAPPCLLG